MGVDLGRWCPWRHLSAGEPKLSFQYCKKLRNKPKKIFPSVILSLNTHMHVFLWHRNHNVFSAKIKFSLLT